jgi:hypothetical protein
MARSSDRKQKQQQSDQDRWDRAYQEVERSRAENDRPDPKRFEDLTKSAGGK